MKTSGSWGFSRARTATPRRRVFTDDVRRACGWGVLWVLVASSVVLCVTGIWRRDDTLSTAGFYISFVGVVYAVFMGSRKDGGKGD